MRLFFLLAISNLHALVFNATEPETSSQFASNEDEQNHSFLHEKYDSGLFSRLYAYELITNGFATSSGQLILRVAKTNSENLVVSPLSFLLSLALASYGTEGFSQYEINRVLALPPPIDDSGVIGIQELIDDLNHYDKVGLVVANAVFISESFEPLPEFIEVCMRAFRATVENMDFEDSIEANEIISEWCEHKTDSRMLNIINHEQKSRLKIVFANTMYVRGTWLQKFNRSDTKNRSFYKDFYTEKEVPTMSLEGSFHHGDYWELDAKFVQLPFESGDDAHGMSMFIILPNTIDGLAHMEGKLDKISLRELIDRGKEERIYIELPSFRIENEIDLTGILKKTKMHHAFDPLEANFTAIHDSAPLAIVDVMQQAVIEVNEEGLEAAAASGCNERSRRTGKTATAVDSAPPTARFNVFIANHPFYVIIATTGGNPLNIFTARFVG